MSSRAAANHGATSLRKRIQGVLSAIKRFIRRLVACKSMDQIKIEISEHNKLNRTLNWFQLTAIGLGAIIGK